MDCQLEKLRLSGCMVTEESCYCLASTLSSNPSHLRELDLSYNHPGHSGVKMLSDQLNHPNSKLEILNFDHGESFRITPGLRKYACDLTLDRNTVNIHLILSENNKKATYLEEEHPDHPEQGRAETFGGAGAQSIKGAHGTWLLIRLCSLLICVSK